LFQLDKNVSTKGTEMEQGTGLGLVLCKEFVELHGGKIWIVSEPNIGTELFFTLPVNQL
jgi:signal transduction histidine kinase